MKCGFTKKKKSLFFRFFFHVFWLKHDFTKKLDTYLSDELWLVLLWMFDDSSSSSEFQMESLDEIESNSALPWTNWLYIRSLLDQLQWFSWTTFLSRRRAFANQFETWKLRSYLYMYFWMNTYVSKREIIKRVLLYGVPHEIKYLDCRYLHSKLIKLLFLIINFLFLYKVLKTYYAAVHLLKSVICLVVFWFKLCKKSQ